MNLPDLLQLPLQLDASRIIERVLMCCMGSGYRGLYCSSSCAGYEGSTIDRPHVVPSALRALFGWFNGIHLVTHRPF